MIKVVFPYHSWFSQDLVDAVDVLVGFEQESPDTFSYRLERWSENLFSVGKYYRKVVIVQREGYHTEVLHWHAKEQLEDLLAIYMYEEEKL